MTFDLSRPPRSDVSVEISFRRAFGLLGGLCCAVATAVSAFVLIYGHNLVIRILAVAALIWFADLFVINIWRVISRRPLLRFSADGIDDPLRALGFCHLSWNEVDVINLGGKGGPRRGKIEIHTVTPQTGAIRFVPFYVRARSRRRFTAPTFLAKEVDNVKPLIVDLASSNTQVT
jgi:hypothetical protein